MASYGDANTAAELYILPAVLHPDFESFVSEPTPQSDNVDVTGVLSPLAGAEDFVRAVFSQKFHVVWSMFDTYPYGPGNYLMAQFVQTPGNDVPDRLRFAQFRRAQVNHELGPIMNVTPDSVAFTGSSFEVLFRRTSHLHNGVSVWNLSATQGGRQVYNYYLVPIEF